MSELQKLIHKEFAHTTWYKVYKTTRNKQVKRFVYRKFLFALGFQFYSHSLSVREWQTYKKYSHPFV